MNLTLLVDCRLILWFGCVKIKEPSERLCVGESLFPIPNLAHGLMEQRVDELDGKDFQPLALSLIQVRHASQHPLKLIDSNLVGLFVEVANRPARTVTSKPAEKVVGAIVDISFHLACSVEAAVAVALNKVREIVEVSNCDSRYPGGFGFDVARNRDINHQELRLPAFGSGFANHSRW